MRALNWMVSATDWELRCYPCKTPVNKPVGKEVYSSDEHWVMRHLSLISNSWTTLIMAALCICTADVRTFSPYLDRGPRWLWTWRTCYLKRINITFLSVTFLYVFRHISSMLSLVLITFRSLSGPSWSCREIQDSGSKMAPVWQSWCHYNVKWRHHLSLRTSKEISLDVLSFLRISLS